MSWRPRHACGPGTQTTSRSPSSRSPTIGLATPPWETWTATANTNWSCKTADGTKDGTGRIIGDRSKDWRHLEEGTRQYGRILAGPEYFTIFDGRTVLAAWDWRAGALAQRWVFDSGRSYPPYSDASPFSGMGGHSLSVGDVDFDGKDEIVYQAMTVDDNGQGLYSTGRRHGDAMHLSDFYPDRPGLEVFLITENEDDTVRFQTPGRGGP